MPLFQQTPNALIFREPEFFWSQLSLPKSSLTKACREAMGCTGPLCCKNLLDPDIPCPIIMQRPMLLTQQLLTPPAKCLFIWVHIYLNYGLSHLGCIRKIKLKIPVTHFQGMARNWRTLSHQRTEPWLATQKTHPIRWLPEQTLQFIFICMR